MGTGIKRFSAVTFPRTYQQTQLLANKINTALGRGTNNTATKEKSGVIHLGAVTRRLKS